MAFYIASTGKPGPVLIDIPKDIQTAAGPAEYPSNIQIRGYKPNESVHIGQLKKAYKLLRTAKKPLILAGGGINIAHANDKLLALAEKMQIPVVTTIMGKGANSFRSPVIRSLNLVPKEKSTSHLLTAIFAAYFPCIPLFPT